MAISEKIELLGKGLYTDIPDVLTLKAIPTASELDYVGGEDFQATMLDTIFPAAIEEKINFRQLLEIDFQWVCRCLRILNYGPYYTTNSIFCTNCGQVAHGEYQVDLRTIGVKPIPEGFKNEVLIPKSEFIDFDGDIVLHLPTIQEMMNADKDNLFKDSNGNINTSLSRLCYMVTSIGGDSRLSVVEIRSAILNKLTSADFVVLKNKSIELCDYGLRAGGATTCPRCGYNEAAFVALVDDRFFRPTLGDLRAWKADKLAQNAGRSNKADSASGQRAENIPTATSGKV